MQFNKLKLYKPITNIVVPQTGYNSLNICLAYFPENTSFLESFNYIHIKPSNSVKRILIPKTKKPPTHLTNKYKRELMDRKLIPARGFFGDYSRMIGKNFYLDFGLFINRIAKVYDITNYNVGRPYNMIQQLMNTLDETESNFYTTVLYSVNIEKSLSSKLIRRRVFPIYKMIADKLTGKLESLPFKRVILHIFNHSNSMFNMVYDEYENNSISRLKSVLSKVYSVNEADSEFVEKEEISKDISSDLIKKYSSLKKYGKPIQDSISNLLQSDSTLHSVTSDNINKDMLSLSALAYNITGDIDKSKNIAKSIMNISDNVKRDTAINNLVTSFSEMMIKRPPITSYSDNPIVTASKPIQITDGKVPSHILEKRKMDFENILRDDLESVFKPFKNEFVPIEVVDLEVKHIESPPGELKKTLLDRYLIKLKDGDGKIHNVTIEIPTLTKNGTFTINGQDKVLVNQLVPFPIFFLKPYSGRFESIYSTITIYSRHLKNTSYLHSFISNYYVPLMMVFGYKVGFKDTMDLFKVRYKIVKEKPTFNPDIEQVVRLLDGRYIIFTHGQDNQVGYEMVESFKRCMKDFPKRNVDVEDTKFWMRVLINNIGTRNCIYMIDLVWKYIVTPSEEKILKSRGYPTDIVNILKYICDEVVKGRVDDRNSVDRQRVRTSEVFTHSIQKQVIAAYNEFLSKKLGGDETAEIRIDPKKAFNEIAHSQNVQALEMINPMEELSMMTRITPIGIGGIPDKNAFPQVAMNVHDTYYGNIDPFETPDGPGIGIQQHLTVGAALTNARGQFNVKDRGMITPTEILSVGPCMVPFVESNDGPRITMGTGQSKQALPLVNPENPAIQTGYESLFTPLLSDSFIKKSPVDGKIVEITDAFITIEDKLTGENITVSIAPKKIKSGQGKYGLSKFKPVVKKGQIVKKNALMAEGANIKNGLISNGINLLTAVMPWKGYNFEDGIVLSKSASNKFLSAHIEEKQLYLDVDDELIFISQIGDTIKKGGIIATRSKALYDVESYNHTHCDGGTLTYIEVYSNVEEEEIPEKLVPIYKDFKHQYELINGTYPTGKFREKQSKIEGILIKFTLEQQLVLNKGDKLNNRHGNKGVVGIIEDDENMPRTPWGEHCEIVINPIGIVNRMNNGQLFEIHCGLISRELSKQMGKLERQAFIKLYERVLSFLDGTKNQQYSKNVIQYLTKISDKKYNEVKTKLVNDRFIPLLFTPFKSPTRMNILDALKVVGLKPKYPVTFTWNDKKIKTDPVNIGYMLVQKLEHLADKKMATRGVGAYVGKTLAPTQGKRRGGGQFCGEYDMYGLLSWDCPLVIEEFFGPLSSDHPTKNEMIGELIQTGECETKRAKTNPVKDLLSQMFTAIHLESQ